MRVPRKYIDSFTASVNFLSADMRTRLGDALALVDMSDIAAARDAVIDIMTAFCGAYTDIAAILGAEFYDGIRAMALGSALGAVAESGWEPDAEDAAVRAMIQGVVDGGSTADFVAQLIDRADSEVRRSANESVARNARRDKAKVSYARVPSGIETCKWCIAIASKGPSFRSMEIASHSHANCDCRVVPDFGDGIQGYDPDYYYDVYKHPENHPEYREARNARRRELYSEKQSVGATKNKAYIERDNRVHNGPLIVTERQEKHVKGTDGWLKDRQRAIELGKYPRSYFSLSEREVQELIMLHAGKGEPIIDGSYHWTKKERCISSRVIGYRVNPETGDEEETRYFIIHYSKDGVHAMPGKDGGDLPDDV